MSRLRQLPGRLNSGSQSPAAQTRKLWHFRASVAVMALLMEVVLSVLVVVLLLIIRIYVVVKAGSECRPGTKGSVAVLAVAGSGDVNNTDTCASP